MNKSIKYIGFSFFGALLLLVLGAAGPIFIPVNNGTGNTTTLNNPKTAAINDLNGTTRIIQIAGGSSGFNDGFGVNRVQIDAGGVIKLKATNAAQLFQLTGDGYGEASFPWTFDNGILVGGSTNSAVWLWNGNSAHYYQALFTDASGNTVIEPDNNLQILHADVTIDKSLAAERVFATNGLFTFGSGSGQIAMTSSNGIGLMVLKPAHNLPAVITNEFNFTNAAAGQILTVISSNNNKIVWGVSNAPATGSVIPATTTPGELLLTDLNGNYFWKSPSDTLYVNESFKSYSSVHGCTGSGANGGASDFTQNIIPTYLNNGTHLGFVRLTVTNWSFATYARLGPQPASSSGYTNLYLGTNTFMEWTAGYESPVNNTTTNLGITIGCGPFATSFTPTSLANFVGWFFNGSTNSNWQTMVKNGSGTTIKATTFAFSTNSWDRLGFQVNTNAGTVVYYTNGVPCLTNSSFVPLGIPMQVYFQFGLITTNTGVTFSTNYAWVDRLLISE